MSCGREKIQGKNRVEGATKRGEEKKKRREDDCVFKAGEKSCFFVSPRCGQPSIGQKR